MNLRLSILLVAILVLFGGTFLVLRFTGQQEASTDEPWLFTSGLKGVTRFRVPLLEKGVKGLYTIRLGFTPLAGDQPGRRLFDVRLQGKIVLPKFDITQVTGGAGKVVVREFKGVEVEGDLLVELTPFGLEGVAATDIDRKLHHLGDNVVAGWKESSPDPEGMKLEVKFDYKADGQPRSLALEQRDVHDNWNIILNGRLIGNLQRDVTTRVTRLAIPDGALKVGANQLTLQPASAKSRDDIEVGRIQLLAGHPASTLINTLEVIREDRKTAAQR